MFKKVLTDDLIKNASGILFHLGVIAASAFVALSLPAIVTFVAKNLLIYWSFIGNEKVFLVSVEICLAILMTLFMLYIGGNMRERKFSRMARSAGFVRETPPRNFFVRRRKRQWKEKMGLGQEVLLIGSTGFRTFVEPQGEFHSVLQNCREAKIMLLDPYGEGAKIRARSIPIPCVNPENLREQILKSIDFLKRLKSFQKNIRLKLYPDPPLFKLAILGDYLWIQHYQSALDVQKMPEFVFQRGHSFASLYIPFYQYFVTRWNHPDFSEYDLETDERIYLDSAGKEVGREKFNRMGEEKKEESESTLR